MLFGAGIVRAAKEVELAPLEWRRERNLASSGLALQVDLTRLAMKDALLGNEIDGDVLEVRQPVPLDGRNGKERGPDVGLIRCMIKRLRQQLTLLLPLCPLVA